MSKDFRRARLKIKGLVQGVFYRAGAEAHARGLGLTGFVQNELDGSVTAVVEGESQVVEDFIKWARSGPSGAQVNDVEISDEEFKGEFNNFSQR